LIFYNIITGEPDASSEKKNQEKKYTNNNTNNKRRDRRPNRSFSKQDRHEDIPEIDPSKLISLKDLKLKNPADLMEIAEEHGVESPGGMLKHDVIFSILKKVSEKGGGFLGEGVLEVLQDGFGFLRSPEANYLAGPDDIYVSPNQIRKFAFCVQEIL